MQCPPESNSGGQWFAAIAVLRRCLTCVARRFWNATGRPFDVLLLNVSGVTIDMHRIQVRDTLALQHIETTILT